VDRAIDSPPVRFGEAVLAEFPVFDFVGGEGEFAEGVFLVTEDFVLRKEGTVPEPVEAGFISFIRFIRFVRLKHDFCYRD